MKKLSRTFYHNVFWPFRIFHWWQPDVVFFLIIFQLLPTDDNFQQESGFTCNSTETCKIHLKNLWNLLSYIRCSGVGLRMINFNMLAVFQSHIFLFFFFIFPCLLWHTRRKRQSIEIYPVVNAVALVLPLFSWFFSFAVYDGGSMRGWSSERKGKNSCGNIENNLLARAEDACIVAYRDVDLMAESPNEDELLFISAFHKKNASLALRYMQEAQICL